KCLAFPAGYYLLLTSLFYITSLLFCKRLLPVKISGWSIIYYLSLASICLALPLFFVSPCATPRYFNPMIFNLILSIIIFFYKTGFCKLSYDYILKTRESIREK
ncbi:MAG: hypothetical protein KAS17_02770, partial [Victivallaceae bacterium]|nr:hypothetical protein [Victivallaceae bacterium]